MKDYNINLDQAVISSSDRASATSSTRMFCMYQILILIVREYSYSGRPCSHPECCPVRLYSCTCPLPTMDHIINTKPCTAQDWAITTKAETDNANHRIAIDALASLLDNKACPSNAVEEITMAYEESIKALSVPDDANNDVSEFYALYLCDAIRTFSGASRRLVDLLPGISRRPDMKHNDESSVKHRNGSVYWRDLPSWSYNFLEHGLRQYFLGFV